MSRPPRTRRLALALVAAVATLSLLGPPAAQARQINYWYTPYGDWNLINQHSVAGSPNFYWSSVRAGYLANPANRLNGASAARLQLQRLGDFCNYYHMGELGERYSFKGLGRYTGFFPPAPVSDYQVFNRKTKAACQADRNNWGQWVFGSRGADCQVVCGMNHWVSFAGTRDYPWGANFPGPELTLRSTFKVQRSGHRARTGNYQAFGYTCALLKDETSTGPGRYIELCLTRWQSASAGRVPREADECTSPPGANAHVDTIWTGLPSGRGMATKTSTQGTVTRGALGRWTVQGTITRSNFSNVINFANARCGRGYSGEPSNYRLIGLESGFEGFASSNSTYFYVGGSESLLQAWTAHN